MYKIFIFLFLIMLFGNSLAFGNDSKVDTNSSSLDHTKKLIGGDRDEHGCLGPAGYSWSKEIGACIRAWEIKDNDQVKAASLAVKIYKNGHQLTVLEVKSNSCSGCFTVKLIDDKQNILITLVKWKLVSIIKFI